VRQTTTKDGSPRFELDKLARRRGTADDSVLLAHVGRVQRGVRASSLSA
jgi:hypothetical protein